MMVWNLSDNTKDEGWIIGIKTRDKARLCFSSRHVCLRSVAFLNSHSRNIRRYRYVCNSVRRFEVRLCSLPRGLLSKAFLNLHSETDVCNSVRKFEVRLCSLSRGLRSEAFLNVHHSETYVGTLRSVVITWYLSMWYATYLYCWIFWFLYLLAVFLLDNNKRGCKMKKATS